MGESVVASERCWLQPHVETSQLDKPPRSPTHPTVPTSLSATSPRLWNTSRDGDATTPWAAVPPQHCPFGEETFLIPNVTPPTQPNSPPHLRGCTWASCSGSSAGHGSPAASAPQPKGSSRAALGRSAEPSPATLHAQTFLGRAIRPEKIDFSPGIGGAASPSLRVLQPPAELRPTLFFLVWAFFF